MWVAVDTKNLPSIGVQTASVQAQGCKWYSELGKAPIILTGNLLIYEHHTSLNAQFYKMCKGGVFIFIFMHLLSKVQKLHRHRHRHRLKHRNRHRQRQRHRHRQIHRHRQGQRQRKKTWFQQCLGRLFLRMEKKALKGWVVVSVF